LPKKTFEIAAEADAHLIVQLKDNQKTLCQQVDAGCANAIPASTEKSIDKKRRNRHETRSVAVFDASPIVTLPEWQPYVAAIIRVERDVLTFKTATCKWEPSRETSFYLSNRPIDAKLAMRAVRHHWHIENKSHHVRDVTLNEDASRIRTKPAIFARFRSFAANVLRFNQKDTIRQDRYAYALAGLRALRALRFG